LLIASAAACSAQVAMAAELEEIVVTAQKREQLLQDVGVSIAAFSGDRLRELGLASTTDLGQKTAGLVITEFAGVPSVSVFTIRGVSQNDFQDHHEGPNAVYVDGVYTSFLGGIGQQMYDVDRVEVLRGPQGTLFGRNATGGLVHVVNRRPSRSFDGYADLTLGEHGLVQFEGAIGGALGETVSGRLSVASNRHDPLVENRIGPDVYDANDYSGRAQLLFQPTDAVDLLLSVTASRTDDVHAGGHHARPAFFDPTGAFDDGRTNFANPEQHVAFCAAAFGTVVAPDTTDCFGYREPDDDPFTGSFDNPGKFDREFYSVSATLDWRFSSFTLTSISNFQTIDKVYSADTDSSPIESGDLANAQDSDQFSQELRIAGEGDDFRWVAGLYYLSIDGDFVTESLARDTFDLHGVNSYTTETESFAVFAQAEYDFTDTITGIFGARWTEDDASMDFRPTCIGFGCTILLAPFPDSAQVVGFKGSQSSGEPSAKLQVNWKPDADWLLYAGVTRGTKAGGFTATSLLTLPPEALPFEPEKLTSYEVGFKSTLFDRRLQLNASAFYYDYEDYQAYTWAGVSADIFNADAEVTGGEIELSARPWEGWQFDFGVSLLDATVKDIALPSGRIADQKMPQAPDLSMNGLVRYEWPAFGGKLSAQVDANYVGERVFDTLNHEVLTGGSYTLANARLGYASGNSPWEVAVFCRNFTDEQFVVTAFDISFLNGTVSNAINAPRWFGGEFRYRW
jgi:iron complex outermembrane receptor protein